MQVEIMGKWIEAKWTKNKYEEEVLELLEDIEVENKEMMIAKTTWKAGTTLCMDTALSLAMR